MADPIIDLTGEIWKPVHANPDQYHVSSLGRVKNVKRGKLMVLNHNGRRGYPRVNISRAGVSLNYQVHTLVCIAFHGPRPPGMCIAHGNGDNKDNRPENLRWATPWENSQDRILHGNSLTGEDHPKAKLDGETVWALRCASASTKLNHATLAKAHGVDRSTLVAAITGKTWRHIPMPISEGV